MDNIGLTKISPFMIILLVVWLIASLLSQLVFISINGAPYDGVAMLASLGQYYYIIIAIELFLWLWLFGFSIVKVTKHFTQNRLKDETGNIGEPAKTITLG